jgi:hypothetical protein
MPHHAVRRGDGGGDAGEIIEGTYVVSGGRVHVEDMEGRHLGSEALRPGVDAASIARSILRKGAPDTFWTPLPPVRVPV